MITPTSDALGHDTVVGPGFSFGKGGGDGVGIKELLQPDAAFDSILRKMKAGKQGFGTFSGTVGSNDEEKMYIAYAPVYVRNYHPLNSSDIASGVKNETILVYSLALVETETGIKQPFESIDDLASNIVNICIGVLAGLIVISILLMVYVAFRVTTSMSKPILQLLDVVQKING